MGCQKSKEAKEEAEEKKERQVNPDAKLCVVLGATGRQGGAVLRAMIEDSNYRLRAVTRNPDSDNAKALADQGVEVVKGDFDDVESLKKALEGANSVFAVTNYHEVNDMDKEIQQGKNIVDAAKECNVEHFVFSGTENVKEAIGKCCKHMDSKATVEEYVKEKELTYTFVHYAMYYEVLLKEMLPSKNDAGEYELGIPMGDVPVHMICVEESGECIHQIFNNVEEYKSKTVGLSSDCLKVEEYAAIMTKKLDDMKFTASNITPEDFGKMDIQDAEELAVMFEFLKTEVPRDGELTRKLHPNIPTFEQWVENKKDTIKQVLQGGAAVEANEEQKEEDKKEEAKEEKEEEKKEEEKEEEKKEEEPEKKEEEKEADGEVKKEEEKKEEETTEEAKEEK